MKKLFLIGLVMVFLIIAPVAAEEWNWAVDGWDGWAHSASWTGTCVETCEEFGPIVVDGHGEHGTLININAGTTSAEVERNFMDPTGVGWNSLNFKGRMTASDVPSGRWMTIYLNGQQAFSGTAIQSPPGNGEDFEFQCSFPRTSNLNIKISHGQNPAWRYYFVMRYTSLKYDSLALTGDQGVSNPEFASCNGYNPPTPPGPTPAPEFPSVFLPVTIIIGFAGAVLFIQRTREH